ncbi:MAG: hypothetical protein FJ290_33440 [Planctomycetes bacterium]|nr:hypothetical protein [Planctomycetota bacterium]
MGPAARLRRGAYLAVALLLLGGLGVAVLLLLGGWAVVALIALGLTGVCGAAIHAILREEWQMVVEETGFVRQDMLGRSQSWAFDQIADINLPSEMGLRVRLASGAELHCGPYREGMLAAYHALLTAWQAWTARNAKGEGAASGTTEGPALDARTDGV